MTKAVELLRKDFYRKGVCAIADIVKTRQEKTNNKRWQQRKNKDCYKRAFFRKGKDNGRTSDRCYAGKSKADNRIKSVQL